ncbi:MAG: hypothetical protein HMLIMOIP_000006 [Candidatus Nitrosomirales archaeon]|jgi:hypothetical protein
MFSVIANYGTRTFNALALETSDGDIVIDTNMAINLVLIGDSWSDEDKTQITKRLLTSYVPMISSEERPAGVRYNYTFNFTIESEDVSNKLFKFIDSIGVKTTVPYPIEQWMIVRQPQLESEGLLYKLIDAFRVEQWLNDLERQDGYTIYFLKPSGQQLGYLHTYGALTRDPDTNREFVQEGLMGFGGKHRFYFIDLTAGPWYYPFIPIAENRVLAEYHKNIYDIDNDEEYYDLIGNYVNDAIALLFTPSYLYSPMYKLNYKMQVFLIDMTSGRALYDVATTYLKPEVIEEAFVKLIPYAQWNSEITGESFDSLPRELQHAILNSVTFQKIGTSDTALVKSSDLAVELRKWLQKTLTEEELQLAEEEAKETVFVPIVLFVFDTPAYVDRVPVVGTAIPDPEHKTAPCCAIVAVDKHSLLDFGTGLSTLAVHEMGHVIGLRHPHDGYSESKNEFNNWFFDWSYTPMSYASPGILGCGLPAERCGLVITEFGAFNLDAIDRGLVLSLLHQTKRDLNNSTLQLQEKGYDKSSFPQDVVSKLSSINDDLQKSKEFFTDMNYFNFTSFGEMENSGIMDDAFDFAQRASMHSRSLLEQVTNLPRNMNQSGLLGNVLNISGPLFIDENNVTSSIHEISEPVVIESEVTSKLDQKINFTVITQIMDSNGYTVSLELLDFTISTDQTIRPSSSFTFERSGEFDVKIFLWTELDNPVPLAPAKDASITLVR